jgi:hypothetical protein
MSFFQILKAKGIFLDYLIHGACAFPHVFSGKWTTEGEVMTNEMQVSLVSSGCGVTFGNHLCMSWIKIFKF